MLSRLFRGRSFRRPGRGRDSDRSSELRRARPAFRDDEARQQLVITVGFVAVIVVAVLILAGAVGAGYYNDHLATVASVDGRSINKDQLNDRIAVLSFRINEAEGRIQEQVAAGTLDETTAQSQIQSYDQVKSTIDSTALEALIDQATMEELARPLGISASASEIDAELAKDAETPEQRDVLAIFVAPETSAGTDLPTQAQVTAAQAKANEALAALKQGQDFGAVAKQYSTDPSKDDGGKYGTLTADDPVDPAWVKALFGAPSGGLTDVIQGTDGVYRIGKVARITPAVPDPTFMSALKKAVSLDAYRTAVAGQVIQSKLEDRIIAQDLKQPVEQVHALEIQINADTSSTAAQDAAFGQVKVSHILYSPNGDPNAATTLDTSDPAWNDAKALADATAAKLKAIPDVAEREKEFATIAGTDSDDTASGAQGGELGWSTYSSFVDAFAKAIFTGDHQPGDIIGPVQSQYGWHVILWEGKRPDPKTFADQLLQKARASGADFGALAKENSDGAAATQGGDLGWVAKGQWTDYHVEQALFGLGAGDVSSSVLSLSDGYYIFKVSERASRSLTPAQVSAIRQNAFADWYQPQKDKLDASGKIYRDPSISASSLGLGG
ncbi:MAG TPA: peptidylprolyl isomerase [Candidatus Limnocylindrales bacterium]|nr:peptidylprolyl isomerase [Candidatus Limnocylindrales bacterium]